MDNENLEKPVLNYTTKDTAKKIYHGPSVKIYGSINELVHGVDIVGADGGVHDDNSGSF